MRTYVLAASFSPDGSQVAAGFAGPGDMRSVVRVIDLADEQVILEIDTAVPNSMAFSPDGRALGVADLDSDVATGLRCHLRRGAARAEWARRRRP